MGKLRGFMEFERVVERSEPVDKRLAHYREFTKSLSEKTLQEQGGRCMDCGIPFCHSGCPLGNLIPDFNDAVYKKLWKEALEILHATNNFPEFTGRLCPAPCESSCVLAINKPPVAIENIEKSIIERGFKENWVQASPPKYKTGKTVAIIGSGPAGLASAHQLNRAGHEVTVLERDDKVGGLLRYGIPNFKLDKHIIDRRISILEKEGIRFETNAHVGKNYSIDKLKSFDAIVICTGSTKQRYLPIKGAELKGVVQAMDYLKKQNKVLDQLEEPIEDLSATNKHIIVIGGGDTGSDCIGTANRQRAKSVTNFEIMHKPSNARTSENPWPYWPFTLNSSSSHKEGCNRNWGISTSEFLADEQGKLIALKTVNVEWIINPGQRAELKGIPGTEKKWPCDMAILALGFTGPEESLIKQLGIKKDTRNNILAHNYKTNIPHIFVAGDARRGQSLIVWAISEGREAAREADKFLMGQSILPTKEKGDLPNV